MTGLLKKGFGSFKFSAYENRGRLQVSRLSNFVHKETFFNTIPQKDNFLVRKFNELNTWYTKLIGLDEVKRCQDRVIAVQEKLLVAQEKRREVGQQLTDIRRRSSELQDQLHKLKRWEDTQRFLELTKEETEVVKMEKGMTQKFLELDREERELFTALSNAVRDSHEKERSQAEYTKYWSIILSITGTFVGTVISMFMNMIRTKELKNLIKDAVGTNAETVPFLESLKENHVQLGSLLKNNEKVVTDVNNLGRIVNGAVSKNDFDELKSAVDRNQEEILEILRRANVSVPPSNEVPLRNVLILSVLMVIGILLTGRS